MLKKSVFFLIVVLLSTLFPIAFAQTGVEVGGILDTNTTWTQENSPYLITETIQIPEGITLTIEAGVTVSFSGEGDMFLVDGEIQAQGTAGDKIVFEGNGADNFFNILTSECSLFLDYCVFDNANRLLSVDESVSQVILRHSLVTNISSASDLYHWHEACFIEYNVFIDAAGFGFMNWFGKDSGATMYVRYNVVKTNSEIFVIFSPNVYHQGYVVQYNSFVDVDETIFAVNEGLGDSIDITATENYWGTTDAIIIDSLILDKNDEINRPETIDYSPILDAPHPEGAILPIMVSFDYSPSAVYADGEIGFDASASFAEYSGIANYTWNFGDGTVEILDDATTTHIFAATGEYDLVSTITDEFGFQNSTSVSITVLEDTVPPVTTDDYDEDWQTSDFTITLTAVDDETDVAETFYKINNGTTKTVSDDGQPLMDEEGSDNELRFWSEDLAGNVEDVEVVSDITLDKTKAVIGDPTATPQTDIQENQDVTIAVNVSDSLSGVDTVTLSYSIDNKTSWSDVSMSLNSTTELWEGVIPGQAIWTNVNYKISAYDLAGNLATSDEADIFSYDVIPEFAPTVILLAFSVLTLGVFVLRKKMV